MPVKNDQQTTIIKPAAVLVPVPVKLRNNTPRQDCAVSKPEGSIYISIQALLYDFKIGLIILIITLIILMLHRLSPRLSRCRKGQHFHRLRLFL